MEQKSNITPKELVKGGIAEMQHYRQGVFYFNVTHTVPTDRWIGDMRVDEYHTYQFTVPVEDIDNGTINCRCRAMELLKWIRQAHENETLIRIK